MLNEAAAVQDQEVGPRDIPQNFCVRWVTAPSCIVPKWAVRLPLYGNHSAPSSIYIKVTDHREACNSRRCVYTGMQFRLKYNHTSCLYHGDDRHCASLTPPTCVPTHPPITSCLPSCPATCFADEQKEQY